MRNEWGPKTDSAGWEASVSWSEENNVNRDGSGGERGSQPFYFQVIPRFAHWKLDLRSIHSGHAGILRSSRTGEARLVEPNEGFLLSASRWSLS